MSNWLDGGNFVHVECHLSSASACYDNLFKVDANPPPVVIIDPVLVLAAISDETVFLSVDVNFVAPTDVTYGDDVG